MTEGLETLSVRELLKRTYSRLCENHKARRLEFPSKVCAEVGDDSDWHRERKGFMIYSSADLFSFNGKNWAISRGEKAGYPADPLDSDIIALDISSLRNPSQELLAEVIAQGSYFKNSVIIGLNNGNLGVNQKNAFGSRMNLLSRGFIEYIAQTPKYDSELVSLATLSPVCTLPTQYKPAFVDVLAKNIDDVLI